MIMKIVITLLFLSTLNLQVILVSDFKSKVIYTNQSDISKSINDYKSVSISRGMNIRNNNMSIQLKNSPMNVFNDGKIQHRWVQDDGTMEFMIIKTDVGAIVDEEEITIYAKYTNDTSIDVESDQYLLMTGIINQGKITASTSNNYIELKCLDRSTVILDRLSIPQAFKGDGTWNSPKVIKTLVRNASNLSSSSKAYTSDGTFKSYGPFSIDARLFSEGLKVSGTNTFVDKRKLSDSSASFTSGLEVGYLVRNTTSNDTAYIISIDSNSSLTLSKDIFTSTGVGYQISDGFIQDFRTDGSVFPSISFSQIDKPIADGIQELSQVDKINSPSEITNNELVIKRGMRFYIDKKNRMHWFILTDTPELEMEYGATTTVGDDTNIHRIVQFDLDKSIQNNVNFIIFFAGEDMNNSQIRDYSRAPFSGSPNKKDSMRRWEDIARTMKSDESKAGNIVFTESEKYAYPVSYNPMPGGDTYPTWDRNRSTIPTTDSSYNALFKVEAKSRAKERAQAEFQELANPRWKGNITIRGEDINVGDLIKFTSRVHGVIDIKIRVKSLTHNISAEQGWITNLSVEEDEVERG